MTKTNLSPVRKDVALARGLPNAHYVDPAVFAEERDAVLFASWSGLAVAADVPEAGDAKPISFLGVPLLLIRDNDGDIRVFQNTFHRFDKDPLTRNVFSGEVGLIHGVEAVGITSCSGNR